MKRIVVVSTNNNPDYYFYSPYVRRAWNNYGWYLLTMITDDVDRSKIDSDYTVILPNVEGLRSETIAQVGRLYATYYMPSELKQLVMTSDIDLIPIADYWHPLVEDITCYGFDLTGRTTYPMGYIAMSSQNWHEVMAVRAGKLADLIAADAKEIGLAYSDKWEQWWNHDQELITKRLLQSGKHIKHIDRGFHNGLALGRIDRYNWEQTQNQPRFIDMHCENNNVQHPDKLAKFLSTFEKFHGKL